MEKTVKTVAVFMCILGILACSVIFFEVIRASMANGYSIVIPCMGFAVTVILFIFGIYETITE